MTTTRQLTFHVVDVPDDATATDVRAHVARAAAVAGITTVECERPDERSPYRGLPFLRVSYTCTDAQRVAFHAALDAEKLTGAAAVARGYRVEDVVGDEAGVATERFN